MSQGRRWIREHKYRLKRLVNSYFSLIDKQFDAYEAGDLLKRIHEEILYHYAALAVAAVEEVRENEEEEEELEEESCKETH